MRTSEFSIDRTGKTDVTEKLQSLIDSTDNILTISPGKYLTSSLFLKSGMTLEFEEGAELIAITDESAYRPIPTRVAGIEMEWYPGLVNCIGVKDVTIRGKGTINGSGPYWWKKYWGEDKMSGMRGLYDPKGLRWAVDYDCMRVRNLLVYDSENIALSDFCSKDSGFWNVHICYSADVVIENLFIDSESPLGPSTDGIDIDSSSNVTVRGCTTKTNDDSICIKSGRDWDGYTVGRPSNNILIENCTVLKGFGVTIGSEVSGGVHDVTIRNMKFRSTDVGFRIKSSRARKGYIRNVVVSGLELVNVKYPVHMNLDWNPSYSYCSLPEGYKGEIPPHWEKLLRRISDDVPDTEVSNIIIKNVRSVIEDDYDGISRAFDISGFAEQPIASLTLQNLDITAKEFGVISCVKNLVMEDIRTTILGSPDSANDEYDNR